MGNVRFDSEFESDAARGRGGAAGQLPAVMRGSKCNKPSLCHIAARRGRTEIFILGVR